MNRYVALVCAVLFSVTAVAGEVTFVANDDELNAALESAARGTIDSVAIAEQFYQGSAKQTKDRIRGLITRTFKLGDRAVYVYGQPLDASLANELLDGRMFCSPAYAIGRNRDRTTCYAVTEKMTEQDMREALSRSDRRDKEQ
jgi:hypothetical protein